MTPATAGNSGKRPSVPLALCLLACVFAGLAACGYHLGADSPSIFSGGNSTSRQLPTLKVKSIEHPTIHPWMGYELRNRLRHEISARHLAAWVDSGRADYEITLKVTGFYYRSDVTTQYDATLLYAADMTLEGLVYAGESGKLVWRSGNISYGQSYELIDEKPVAVDLATNIIRQLADKMRQAF